MQIDIVTQQQNINKKTDHTFLCDVLCFFAGLQAGQVDNYCYSEPEYAGDLVCGGILWESFINEHNAYYPFLTEVELIARNIETVARACKGAKHFIDLGPGSIEAFKKKTLPLLRAIAPVQYRAVDMNEEFALNIMRYLRKNEPFMHASYSLHNFFDYMLPSAENSVIYLTGITLSNIKADLRFETMESQLIKTFEHFSRALHKGGRFIFTYDANQDGDSIKRSYAHKAMAKHNTNFINLVQRDLPTHGLHEEDFEHVMAWDAKQHLLKQCLRTKRDVVFDIAGHSFNLEACTTLHVTNCFKFTDDIIRRTSQRAGFSDIKICTLDGSSMRMAILEKDPQ